MYLHSRAAYHMQLFFWFFFFSRVIMNYFHPNRKNITILKIHTGKMSQMLTNWSFVFFECLNKWFNALFKCDILFSDIFISINRWYEIVEEKKTTEKTRILHFILKCVEKYIHSLKLISEIFFRSTSYARNILNTILLIYIVYGALKISPLRGNE